MAEQEQSFIREAVSNSGCAAVVGCLWLVAALLLLPLIWVSLAYDYGPAEWVMLLQFPNDPAEKGLWVLRIGLTLVFLGSTAWLVAHVVTRGTQPKG